MTDYIYRLDSHQSRSCGYKTFIPYRANFTISILSLRHKVVKDIKNTFFYERVLYFWYV